MKVFLSAYEVNEGIVILQYQLIVSATLIATVIKSAFWDDASADLVLLITTMPANLLKVRKEDKPCFWKTFICS